MIFDETRDTKFAFRVLTFLAKGKVLLACFNTRCIKPFTELSDYLLKIILKIALVLVRRFKIKLILKREQCFLELQHSHVAHALDLISKFISSQPELK